MCELHVSSEIFWSLSNDLTMSTEHGDPSVTVSIISSHFFLYVTVSLWMFDISFFITLEQRVVLSAVLVISILVLISMIVNLVWDALTLLHKLNKPGWCQ